MPSLAAAPLSRTLRLQTGVLAAIGFCIKPHCALLFAGIQLLFLLKQKRLSILFSMENVTVYLAAMLYLGSVYDLSSELLARRAPHGAGHLPGSTGLS
jgi:hypothetical protein